MESKCVGVISLMGSRALTSVVLMALWLLHPSVQFSLVHVPAARRAAGLPRDQDAISAPGKLVTADNTPPPIQASPLGRLLHQHPHTAPDASPSSSSHPPLPIPPAGAHTAHSRKTNRGGENFRTSHRLGETPTESLREAHNAEGVVKGKKREGGSTGLRDSQHKQAVTGGGSSSTSTKQQHHHVSDNYKSHGEALHNQDIPFTEVVQVELDADPLTEDRFHTQADRTNGGGGGDVNSEPERVVSGRNHKASSAEAVVVLAEAEQQSLQQQAVAHKTADPHVSKMVLTAIGSLTAILGVCVMAAIFQCCCRRKRSRSPEGREGEEKEEEEEAKKGLKPKNCSSQDNARSSRSPSPLKGATKEEDEEEEAERGQSEKDSLLDENKKDAGEDEDLGDFSMVQRETSILRSYRKPPPPKNRARASRVPRALKTVDPNASPSVFQELVDKEKTGNTASETPQKATNGFASSDTMSPDMQSSMLADIDSTLAAMHSTQDSSPSRSADRSRETSVEKQTPKTGSDDSQLKPPAKPSLPASPSKEQLAKALAQELTRSTSKEMLAKPQSRSSTPKSSKETTPKSQSAGASPKTVHGKNLSGASSKDSVGGPNSDGANGDSRSGPSPEEGDKKQPGNIFALIDPTTKEKGEDAGSKSKIPVRAASSPTQPTAPLRLSSGKDKRFPVPSVHGDQLDQLMKSLKTRLKEDDGEGSKQVSNTVSPGGKPAQDDDLDPTSRDRSHSDPTKKQEEKGKKLHQTHL